MDEEQALRETDWLVKLIARRYRTSKTEIKDLVQVGRIGVIYAAREFDAARKIKFATFAEYKITSEIRHYIRDNRYGNMRIPAWVQEAASKGNEKAKQASSIRIDSLSYMIESDDSDLDIEDTDSDPSHKIINYNSVALLLAPLSEVDSKIIKLRYGYEYSEKEVADMFGVAPHKIKRRVKRSLKNIHKNAMEQGYIGADFY